MSESEYNDDLDADEELVGNAPAQKNLRGVVIAVVVIVSILALIGAAILWLTPRTDELHLGEPITFTEAMSMMRKMRQLRYQWLSCSKRGATADVLVYLNASSGDIMQASFDQNNDTVSVSRLLSKDQFSEGSIGHFVASRDCQTLLIQSSPEKIYRHSSSAFYKLVALPKAPGQRITEKSLCPEGNCEVNPARLRAVQWGSDGAFVAFVFDNNIYYSEKPFEEPAVKITNSPLDPAITVGTCNWVYEEEILESSDAFWVSPGDERIAYLVFNDSAVQAYRMPWYGSPTNMYIQQRGVPYPKAGSRTPLTEVSLRVYDIASRRTIELSKPMAVPQEHYVTLVRWFNSTHLIVGWVNRNQDRGFLGVCDLGTASATATCRLFFRHIQRNGWMDFNKQKASEPLMDPASERLFIVLHNSGYRRIAALRLGGSNQVSWVSPASYDVADILHHDAAAQHLHFLSCRGATDDVQDATMMHLHRIAAVEGSSPAYCITCPLKNCLYNRASYSISSAYFLLECLGPDPYTYAVFKNSYPGGYKAVMSVETNDEFKAGLVGKNMPRIVFRKIKLREKTTKMSRADPLEVNAKLVLPYQLNESHISQYPLVLKVYGGPFSQMVTRKFEFGWQHYLASSLYIMSASIDGRGTGNRGSDFLFSIKNNFANVELEDQMDSLASLRELQYVNKSCIAVFGWSYGGFMALHMMGHESNANNSYFSTAVAVAPVTDFYYYNTGYTERYLGVKSDETSENYKRTNVSRLAPNFWNKDLLLAHGTGDDNVHYQNSAQFVKVLVEQKVNFEFATYPDEDHSMRGAQKHLFLKVTSFLLNSFNKTSERKRFLNSEVHKYCPKINGTVNQC
ncbi:hypothetical protein BOX15_Mlig002127g4 [Macrostomum lignano]|uniref:Uncharacterized protein n=1 Tax=Macrostomum lignano TaxID=282301 RepID=A0A267FSN9_9PLAT|nr:hypothetical protein BOX15_Mlig002127g4 [Macrostomum lignano]